MTIVTIGLDLAKSVFHLHAIDEQGAVIVRKRLTRGQVLPTLEKIPPCLIGMEACGSAHHWAREIQALGHEVCLMPAQYVKPYVKQNKTDAADAEAICEAVRRPTMRFVSVKSIEQQAVMLNHRSRELLVKQRTMLANAIRVHFAEFGIITAQETQNLCKLKTAAEQAALPKNAMDVLDLLFDQLDALNKSIKALELRIHAWHKSNETSQRLTDIPGIGPLTASAIVASVGTAGSFGTARSFAAWLGLTPRDEHSCGGKQMMGGISKRGDGYIRKLLVHGWCMAHALWCECEVGKTQSLCPGWMVCWNANIATLQRWLWPIKMPEWFGHCGILGRFLRRGHPKREWHNVPKPYNRNLRGDLK